MPIKTDTRRFSRREKIILAAVLLIGLLATYLLPLLKPDGTKVKASPVIEMILKDTQTPRHAPRLSDSENQVTVVVFTDYQCPACRIGNDTLQKLIAEDDHLRVLFVDWPIFGETSDHLARLAMAARYQGRYTALHDIFMKSREFDETSLKKAFQAANVDDATLASDLSKHGRIIDAQISSNRNKAFALGLRGTPSYLIGPYLVEGVVNERRFKRIIERVRREGSDFHMAKE